MEKLIPRLIGEVESKSLGLEKGWYGRKVSGTIMTGASRDRSACIEAIGLVAQPARLANRYSSDALRDEAHASESIYVVAQTKLRTASQLARKP